MRIQFRITSILLLMLAIGIGLSCTLWFQQQRLKRSDALAAKFDELGVRIETNAFILPFPFWQEMEKSNPSFMETFLNDTKVVQGVPRFDRILIDHDEAKFIANSIATQEIEQVIFDHTEIDSDACCFLSNWQSLEGITFFDVDIPELWKEGIIEAHNIQDLSLSLGTTGFSLDDLKRLTHLKTLLPPDLNLDQQEKESLVQALPNTNIVFKADF